MNTPFLASDGTNLTWLASSDGYGRVHLAAMATGSPVTSLVGSSAVSDTMALPGVYFSAMGEYHEYPASTRYIVHEVCYGSPGITAKRVVADHALRIAVDERFIYFTDTGRIARANR